MIDVFETLSTIRTSSRGAPSIGVIPVSEISRSRKSSSEAARSTAADSLPFVYTRKCALSATFHWACTGELMITNTRRRKAFISASTLNDRVAFGAPLLRDAPTSYIFFIVSFRIRIEKAEYNRSSKNCALSSNSN
jgi:hypothetical protein